MTLHGQPEPDCPSPGTTLGVRRGVLGPLPRMCGLAWRVPCGLEAGKGFADLPSVHESVDDLRKKAAFLCTQRKMLGIVTMSWARSRAFTWKNTTNALCINRTRKLSTCHAVITRN